VDTDNENETRRKKSGGKTYSLGDVFCRFLFCEDTNVAVVATRNVVTESEENWGKNEKKNKTNNEKKKKTGDRIC